MFMAFEFHGGGVFRAPLLNAVWIVIVGALMISRVPTLSTKRFRIKHEYVVPLLLVAAVLAAFLTTAPWPTLTVIGVAYVATIPWTIASYTKLKRAYEAAAPTPVASDAAAGTPAEPRASAH
jgi:CDP-diacylglycerol--serine O-phosphatidyltransferase